MKFKITYLPFGQEAVLLQWPTPFTKDILLDMRNLADILMHMNLPFIRDINYCYNSMSILIDKQEKGSEALIDRISNIYNHTEVDTKLHSRKWMIPVCYDLDFGIDLIAMSQTKKMDPAEIIKLHIQPEYTVYGIGFLPGFLYLGGLDKRLHQPRKKDPRLVVTEGAVGIGGTQTGVYPMESPGGWNIIGRTPLKLFDVNLDVPTLIKPGDSVKFCAINKDTFESWTQDQSIYPQEIRP